MSENNKGGFWTELYQGGLSAEQEGSARSEEEQEFAVWDETRYTRAGERSSQLREDQLSGMEKPSAPVAIFYFCSDSSTDAPLLEQLERHLSALQCEGLIATWHKRQIVAGSVRQVELDRHLNTAVVISLHVGSVTLGQEP